MQELTSISQLLTAAGCQFSVYDLGRRVQAIDMMAFTQIEQLSTPYPYPIQGYAQFAVVFWKQPTQHFVWFIKLPLDERGLLSPAARSQFIQMVIETLGRDVLQDLEEDQQRQLGQNQFNFTPSQEKMAMFNALVRQQFKQQASLHYEAAVDYFHQQHQPQAQRHQWQQLGLQGIADIAARLTQFNHAAMLTQALPHIADEACIALCQALEHVFVPDELAQALLEKQHQTPQLTPYLLRALASQPVLVAQLIEHIAKQQELDAELLISISGRSWLALTQAPARQLYLEALAKQPQHFFNQVFIDMVAIPALRLELLSAIRSPERSETLATAIGGLMRAMHA